MKISKQKKKTQHSYIFLIQRCFAKPYDSNIFRLLSILNSKK